MFSLGKIKDGAAFIEKHGKAGDRIHTGDLVNEYYNEKGEVRGHWIGNLAPELGLSGELAGNDFKHLFSGINPLTGEKLRQRESGLLQGFDFQCSAQKSLSIMSEVVGDTRLRKVHEAANMEALREAEKFIAHRVGGGAFTQTVRSGNMVGAIHHHDCSRSLDPQIHTHCFVANVTKGADGRFYAIDNALLVDAIRYCGKVYQSEVRKGTEELGYKTTTEYDERGRVTGWEIEGVSKEIRDAFSKRSIEIEEAAKKLAAAQGYPATIAQRDAINLATRNPKLTEISPEELQATQRVQITPEELAGLQRLKEEALHRGSVASPMSSEQVQELISSTREHIEERKAIFKEHELLAESLNRGMGRVDIDRLRQEVESDKSLVRLSPQEEGASGEFTTTKHINLEQDSIHMIERGNGRAQAINPEFAAWTEGSWEGEKFIEKGGKDVTEQKAAVEAMLRSENFVHNLRGVAGAGKTTALQQFAQGCEEAGRSVVFLAPTAAAVEVLHKEGFGDSQTISLFMTKEQVIKPGTVLVVDEAGFLSNKQGHDLLKIAESHGAVVRLVGDTRQLTAVEAGDWLRTMEKYSPLARSELSEIRRQKHEEYRAATTEMSGGNVVGGLEKLDSLGWIKESGGDYLKNAANDFLTRIESGKKLVAPDGKIQCLGLSPTHAENRTFTGLVRADLIKTGALGKEAREFEVFLPADATKAQKKDVRSYEVGRAVTLAHGSISGGVRKNEIYTVAAVDLERQRVELRDSKGKAAILNVQKDGAKMELGKIAPLEIREGDRLRIGKNQYQDKLFNGQIETVKGFDDKGRIELQSGKIIPQGFQRFGHGYAVTVASAQGATCKEAVAFGEKFKANEMYVASSRSTDSMALHVAQKERVFENVARHSGMRKSATEGIQQRNRKLSTREAAHADAMVTRSREKGQIPSPALESSSQDKTKKAALGRETAKVPARELSAPAVPTVHKPAKVTKFNRRSQRQHPAKETPIKSPFERNQRKPTPLETREIKRAKSRNMPEGKVNIVSPPLFKTEEKKQLAGSRSSPAPAKAIKGRKDRVKRADKKTSKIGFQGKSGKGRKPLPDAPKTPSEKAQEKKETSLHRKKTDVQRSKETTRQAIEKRIRDIEAVKAKRKHTAKTQTPSPTKSSISNEKSKEL